MGIRKKYVLLLVLILLTTFTQQQLQPFVESIQLEKQKVLANDIPNIDFLKDRGFAGEYISHDKKKLFNYISSEKGQIQAVFFYNPDWGNIRGSSFNGFLFQVFDPVYHDRNIVQVGFKLEDRVSDYEWKSNSSQIQVNYIWKGRDGDPQKIQNCSYSIIIQNGQSQDYSAAKIKFSLQGKDFYLTSNLSYDDDKWSIIGYCFYTSFIVSLQILALTKLLKRIDNQNPAIAQKISLTTVSICNIMDFYLTIIHIQFIITQLSSYYLFYVLPAVAYILLFIIYDMKLLFMVWRSHTMRDVQNAQDLRKSLTLFYIKFYVGLFAYLGAIYFFVFDEWFIIMQNLIFIPQVIRNARIGNNPGFQPYYIFGYLGLRFFKPLYQRACPNNNFVLMPMYGVVITIFILFVVQMLLLFLQGKFGARFFIPKIFQPDYFNYQVKIKYSEDTHELECTICLQNFFDESPNSENLNASELLAPAIAQKTVLRTPCNHYFHRDCLTSWIDVKLECPTCRKPLPPIL